ncbi:bifunctional ornithine acetyltransferase/N-acetylglutamate synthase [Halioglobus japonicus]|uniref:Arginine biosynthesis bifunctional protein ArgJ n=1 Tax=Halioglobus japonicus TaxID=930805 RepID=A0AAP8MFY8_9GAMM|nr:bifunctional glutamate N-acetyltransferase/amino-acid acetyltransferase ArgJ [Halioglobus japonicus]AQA19768.1 bifunctional ornithine acetyltransferase/N-acetylglutamate synthase [Halioglobus japonicus]PLW87160.1 bifunctional glutamate N-acetyltransferase/amino-acid acetyltransferase ArgJ [Halioglobus japonicus]GHD09912.1 arginine biosynthesis bifunctional protein ArgJ [Halioglobus japonicus]
MAVGNDTLPKLLPVPGLRLATVSAGVKTPGRKDLVLMELAPGANCAGVFTQNAFCAAPVAVAESHLGASQAQPRYLLVNTGNANAGTGETGLRDARACCAAVAEATGSDAAEVLPFSTGVIGEPLPVEKITAAIPAAVTGLDADGWADAAEGILTTDTRPKGLSVSFNCDGIDYVVTGIAKGAGMIRPNMATMLGYIATDAAVAPELLQRLLSEATDMSFNRVSVDGDTSTNDACVLVATGAAGNAVEQDAGSALALALRDAVQEVAVTLAQALVRDGEGASKFVTVAVEGGLNEQECLDVAFTIAHSPLVKTALFASDPNWGRLLAAIGRAGLAELDVDRVGLYLNDVLIAERGCRAASYTEEQGVAAMAAEDIVIRVCLNRGDAAASVWTTDFSYDYVRINAEYRT